MSEIHLGARTQEQLGQETLTPEERQANLAALAGKPPELTARELGATPQNDRAPATFTEAEEQRIRELEASGILAPGAADLIIEGPLAVNPVEVEHEPSDLFGPDREPQPGDSDVGFGEFVDGPDGEEVEQLEDDLARADAAIADALPESPFVAPARDDAHVDQVLAESIMDVQDAIIDLRTELADLKDTAARAIAQLEANQARLRQAIATSEAGQAYALYERLNQRIDQLAAFLTRATGVTPPNV